MKLDRLIKMCLNQAYSKVCIGKHLSEFSYPEWSKKRDPLSSLPFNFTLEYSIRKVQENHVRLKWNVTRQLLTYADMWIYCEIDTVKKNKETLIDASREVSVEINV
jgi:hypothetical protein